MNESEARKRNGATGLKTDSKIAQWKQALQNCVEMDPNITEWNAPWKNTSKKNCTAEKVAISGHMVQDKADIMRARSPAIDIRC